MKVRNRSENHDTFPVMLFSTAGRLISANLTAQPLLHHWNCRNGQLPQPQDHSIRKLVMETITGMQSGTIDITFSGLKLRFDVVPFPEAGYTGFYGFQIENLLPEHVIQKIRLNC